MLQILLLSVHALPAYVPYNGQVVPIDYDSATGLAVGTQEKYVSKVVEAARWAGLTPVDQVVGSHRVTGWRAGGHTKGIYLTHTTKGQNWKTYVPGIDQINAVTAANLDSLLAMYAGISQSPGMQSKDLFDFVVPQVVRPLLQEKDPSVQEIVAALPVLNSTRQALSKTAATSGSEDLRQKLWQKHRREENTLAEKHSGQIKDLERVYQEQKLLLQRKLDGLLLQHQAEIAGYKPLATKLAELDGKRISERQEAVRTEKRGEEQQTAAKLKAIEAQYAQLKSKLESEHPKDVEALKERQEKEAQGLKKELQDLKKPFGFFLEDDEDRNENTEFDRLRATQRKAEQDLRGKHQAETDQHEEQRRKMEDAARQLEQRIGIVLTPKVAEALEASNPTAVKGFLELLLEHGDPYGGEDWRNIVSELAGKIGSVASLDLSQAKMYSVVSLFRQEPAFIPVITSPATLSTIQDIRIFGEMLNVVVDQTTREYRDEEFDQFRSQHHELFTLEIEKTLFGSAVAKIRQEQQFETECNNLENIIDSKDGFTRQAIDSFFVENEKFFEVFKQKCEEQARTIPRENFLKKAAEKFAVEPGSNQKIWEELRRLLRSSEERKQASQKLYKDAFVRVVSEMQRRFEAAEQSEKGMLVEVAKRVWAPYSHANEERQEQMRGICPEAAQMLEEMARKVQSGHTSLAAAATQQF